MTALTDAGLGLLDTATESACSLEGLTTLGSGSGAGPGLGLLDIALEGAISASLTILGLGNVVGRVAAPWMKNPV